MFLFPNPFAECTLFPVCWKDLNSFGGFADAQEVFDSTAQRASLPLPLVRGSGGLERVIWLGLERDQVVSNRVVKIP
jgi:hypothetical protein